MSWLRRTRRVEPRGVCPDCGAALLQHEADVQGSAEEVEVRLQPLPVLACPSGHVRRLLTPDWAQVLLDSVRDQLPLWNRHPDCGHDRWAAPASEQVRLQVSLDPVPVRVRVTAPLLRCRVCRAPGLTRETSVTLGVALVAALGDVRR